MKGILFIRELALKSCQGLKTQTRRALGLYPGIKFTDAEIAQILADCDYKAGERRALLTTWAVAPEFDHLKPTQLDPNQVASKFWHAGQGDKPAGFGKSRPGMFLPSKIRAVLMPMFDIEDVRIECLHDMNGDDAVAEGFTNLPCENCAGNGCECCNDTGIISAGDNFIAIWDRINAGRGFSWDANPVVAVITFEKL